MSFVSVLKSIVPDLSSKRVYELSSRGPLVDFLTKRAGSLTLSEYLENVPPGECRGHFQCQDVQKLTYPDNSFDVCTCTEVFEHVANDVKGFSEIYRVLTEGGVFVFKVPLRNNTKTVERAVLVNGKVEHLLEPEYHGDHLRGDGMVLCFCNYGTDIVDRVASVAFKDVRIINTTDPTGWNFNRPVVVALKWEIICRDEN